MVRFGFAFKIAKRVFEAVMISLLAPFAFAVLVTVAKGGFTVDGITENIMKEVAEVQYYGAASSPDHMMVKKCVSPAERPVCSEFTIVETLVADEAKQIAANASWCYWAIFCFFLFFLGIIEGGKAFGQRMKRDPAEA